jgi:DNA invertase Pin-like site-specific DNA recombinase
MHAAKANGEGNNRGTAAQPAGEAGHDQRKCVVYLRCRGLNACDRQLAVVQEYATANGYSVADVFSDHDAAGRLDADRPALDRLRSGWADFNTVIVSDWPPLSRAQADLLALHAEAAAYGVTLLAATDGPVAAQLTMTNLYALLNETPVRRLVSARGE